MNFEAICQNIMNLDPSIRYAVIQNIQGEKVCGGLRDGITPYLSDDEIKMMHYYAGQRWDTRKKIAHRIGDAKYAMAEYAKIKRISFPLDEKHLLLLSTEVTSDHSNIITSVLELINRDN